MASDLEELESVVASHRAHGRPARTRCLRHLRRQAFRRSLTRGACPGVDGTGRAARGARSHLEEVGASQRGGLAVGGDRCERRCGARTLETARRLEELPETADAFRAGELSEAQAAEIAAAATFDPAAEHRLLETVRGSKSFKGVRDACREVSMRAVDDREKARWLHEQRSAHWWTDGNGHWRLDAKLSPDDAAWVESALKLKTEEFFQAARARGETAPHAASPRRCAGRDRHRQRPEEAARRPSARGPESTRPRLRRARRAMRARRHRADPGHHGPRHARRRLGHARRPRRTGDITHISSMSRTIPDKLRRYVEEAFPCCGVEGCTDDWRLEIDHIIRSTTAAPPRRPICGGSAATTTSSRRSTTTESSADDSSHPTTPTHPAIRHDRGDQGGRTCPSCGSSTR